MFGTNASGGKSGKPPTWTADTHDKPIASAVDTQHWQWRHQNDLPHVVGVRSSRRHRERDVYLCICL